MQKSSPPKVSRTKQVAYKIVNTLTKHNKSRKKIQMVNFLIEYLQIYINSKYTGFR